MKKQLGLGFVFLSLCFALNAQTQKDTIYSSITETAVVIDGVADEACWEDAEWYDINQVWMPYDATMADGDFEGRFKTSWDGEYLYVLVEVVDNMLSDDHNDPLDNWWNDDCLEIFIDEDHSGGWHEKDENAFAYHISLSYDAIDLASNGGINYKEHVDVIMDTIGENTYLWEMAINIYGDTYDHSSPEDSRVTLGGDKLMGFTIAYCDNDETTSRENFIGSVELPADKNNICYQDASYFGTMLLKGEAYVPPTAIYSSNSDVFAIYPNPANDYIMVANDANEALWCQVYSLSGVLLLEFQSMGTDAQFDISTLPVGAYSVVVKSETAQAQQLLIKR